MVTVIGININMTDMKKIHITLLSDGELGPWEESMHRIVQSLESDYGEQNHEFYLDIARLEIDSFTEGTLGRLTKIPHCIICHPTEQVLSSLLTLPQHACWILVSGGTRPIEGTILSEVNESDTNVIWFEGVYGNEEHFRPWIKEWASHGFSNQSFKASSDALLTGRAGIGLVAARLGQSLVPLIMILEAFVAVDEKLKNNNEQEKILLDQSVVERRVEMHRWLCDSLNQMWFIDQLFRNMSKDAAIIHGAIRNSDRKTDSRLLALKDLLAIFLPSCGFHGFEFDPELDESMRKLINKKIASWEDTIETVTLWNSRLTTLSSLLDSMPDVL